jgi:hypothetical protein
MAQSATTHVLSTAELVEVRAALLLEYETLHRMVTHLDAERHLAAGALRAVTSVLDGTDLAGPRASHRLVRTPPARDQRNPETHAQAMHAMAVGARHFSVPTFASAAYALVHSAQLEADLKGHIPTASNTAARAPLQPECPVCETRMIPVHVHPGFEQYRFMFTRAWICRICRILRNAVHTSQGLALFPEGDTNFDEIVFRWGTELPIAAHPGHFMVLALEEVTMKGPKPPPPLEPPPANLPSLPTYSVTDGWLQMVAAEKERATVWSSLRTHSAPSGLCPLHQAPEQAGTLPGPEMELVLQSIRDTWKVDGPGQGPSAPGPRSPRGCHEVWTPEMVARDRAEAHATQLAALVTPGTVPPPGTAPFRSAFATPEARGSVTPQTRHRVPRPRAASLHRLPLPLTPKAPPAELDADSVPSTTAAHPRLMTPPTEQARSQPKGPPVGARQVALATTGRVNRPPSQGHTPTPHAPQPQRPPPPPPPGSPRPAAPLTMQRPTAKKSPPDVTPAMINKAKAEAAARTKPPPVNAGAMAPKPAPPPPPARSPPRAIMKTPPSSAPWPTQTRATAVTVKNPPGPGWTAPTTGAGHSALLPAPQSAPTAILPVAAVPQVVALGPQTLPKAFSPVAAARTALPPGPTTLPGPPQAPTSSTAATSSSRFVYANVDDLRLEL